MPLFADTFGHDGRCSFRVDGVGDLFQSSGSGPTPIQGLLVFAAWGLTLWVIAAVLLKRRDA